LVEQHTVIARSQFEIIQPAYLRIQIDGSVRIKQMRIEAWHPSVPEDGSVIHLMKYFDRETFHKSKAHGPQS